MRTPDSYKRELARVKNRRLEWLNQNGPCVDCGSWVKLQVDHDNPKTKVSHRIWSWSEARRNQELRKCKPRCLKCHQAKTAKEIATRMRKTAPKGFAWCAGHQQFITNSNFHKNRSRWTGLAPDCKDCANSSKRRGRTRKRKDE